jgi:hypothetical protein
MPLREKPGPRSTNTKCKTPAAMPGFLFYGGCKPRFTLRLSYCGAPPIVRSGSWGRSVNWMQFVSSVIASLAWPLAIVLIVLNFKPEIKRLLSQIRKLGAAGLNLELSDQVKEIQEVGEAVELEKKDEPREISVIDPGLMNLAQSFPEAAVLQSFKSVEAVLLTIRQRLPDDKPHRNLNEVLKALADDNQISQTVVTLFQSLRQARNTAAHGSGKLTQGEAVELISQMKNLQNLLEAVLKKLPPKSDRI